MDHKSKEIYHKIENYLEERKGRERRDEDEKPVKVAKKPDERRKSRDRRSNAE
jgi:hypothetical protein